MLSCFLNVSGARCRLRVRGNLRAGTGRRLPGHGRRATWVWPRVREAPSITPVHGISANVIVQARSATCESHRIFGRPPASNCIVVASPELRQPRIRVLEPTCEPKWLGPGCGVGNDIPKLIPVEALDYGSRSRIDDEAQAPNVVGDEPVRRASAGNHVLGHVGLAAVNKARLHRAVAIQPDRRLELSPVEEALYQGAVDLLPDPPVPPVDEVIDRSPVRKRHMPEVPEGVVVVARRPLRAGLR